jgi:23S rRNA (guanine1835-N2)-methyltransferase
MAWIPLYEHGLCVLLNKTVILTHLNKLAGKSNLIEFHFVFISNKKMETLLQVPQGQFQLRRMPLRKNELLRAWDAADEYLLNELAMMTIHPETRILILNDTFGALTVALHEHHPVAVSDSWLAQQATGLNLEANGISLKQVTLLTSLEMPQHEPDLVLIKIPKTLALLEYQLIRLQPLLSDNCQVIAAGMVKNFPASVWPLMERLLGPVTTSRAQKKARLLSAKPVSTRTIPSNPYPTRYVLENTDYRICNHANVFSRDSLDIGTRFLLQHLPSNPNFNDFIDLGCGNGVVGLMLANQHPAARICFVDESFMAIASARENFSHAFGEDRIATFLNTDCLDGIAPESADCIVCNPPFHQQHTVGSHIARQMFRQARKVLRKGGELRVIGNRHLPYSIDLKRLFGQCRMIAENRKFVILSVTR